MKQMKKIVAAITVLAVMLTSYVPVSASVTTAQTPTTSEEAKLNWATKIGKLPDGSSYNNLSEIAISGQYIYAADDSQHRVIKIDKSNGKIIAEGQYINSKYLIHYGASVCYGEGKVFVGYDNGIIQAFDAKSLKSLWVSEKADYAISAKMIYDNGTLYVGTGSYAGAGSYYAVSVKDEDSEKKDKIKKFLWHYQSDSTFYWNQGVIAGNYLIVADNQGNVISLDKNDGKAKDSMKLNSSFSGGIALDAEQQTIYLTAKETATLYGIKLNPDGAFGSVKTVNLYEGGYVASTPEVYKGKVYIAGKKPSDSYYAKGFMAVVDVKSDQYKVNYTVELPAYSQSTPVVVKDGNKVNIYFTINAEPGGIYAIEDSENANSAKLKEIFLPVGEQVNYCANNLHADSEGNLYYINDSRYLFAVGKKTSTPIEPSKPTTPSQPSTPVVSSKPLTYQKTSTRKVKVSWKKKSGAKGYVIYAKAGKGKYKKITTAGKVSSKTVTLKSGYSYKFKVRPYKYVKKGKKKVRKYWKSYQAKGKNGSKTVKATYRNVKGYEGYVIYLKEGKGSYKKVKTTTKGGTITYTKSKAKTGKTYSFRLKGYKTVNGKKVYTTLKVKTI